MMRLPGTPSHVTTTVNATWQRTQVDHTGHDKPIYILETLGTQWRIRRVTKDGSQQADTELDKAQAWQEKEILNYGN